MRTKTFLIRTLIKEGKKGDNEINRKNYYLEIIIRTITCKINEINRPWA
jgi:hypothetical protein